MATKKISALTELTTPAGTEELIVNAGGTSKKIQIDNLPSSLDDNSVTLAKMASGTDGNLITYDASGDPAYVTTGTSGQVLTSGGTGVAPTFQAAAGGGKVLQVVQYTEATDYTNTTTSYTQGPQTGTFTLTNSSNKVLIIANFQGSTAKNTIAGGYYKLYRGSIATGTALTGGAHPMNFATDPGAEIYDITTMQYLDTPGANTTYSIGITKHVSASNGRIYGSFFNTNIIMMEIEV